MRECRFVDPFSTFSGMTDQQFERWLDQTFPPAAHHKPAHATFKPAAAVKPAAPPAPAAPVAAKFSAAEQAERDRCGIYIQLFGVQDGGRWFADGKSLKECYAILAERKEAALPD